MLDRHAVLALVSDPESSPALEQLSAHGLDVRIAPIDDLEALVIRERFVLIVLHGLDGEAEAIEKLAVLRERAGVPFVVVGALPDPRARARILELGGEDVLTFPFSPEQLALRVRGILARLEQQARQRTG
jgi:DNA-binding response OmpR family regulator